MKKILSIIIFCLFFCTNSYAEFIELNKCYQDKYKNFLDQHDKEVGINFLNHTININLDTNIITETIIREKKNLDEWNKYLEDQFGRDGAAAMKQSRITQTEYNIITYTSGLISAENIVDRGYLIDEKKLFIDLETLKFDKNFKMFYTNKYLDGSKAGDIAIQNDFQYVCEDTNSQFDEEKGMSSGTAFFINNKGYLLTNNHVVEGCSLSKITYKNKDYETKLIATDQTLDLALLKADIKPKTYFSFARDEIKKLNKVYVAGYPLGKGLSDDLKISSGIISSLKGFKDNSNEIQVDAPINPGNSGGPIINENGDLVAIAVSGLAKDQTEGINFGIKSSAAETFLKANNINPKKSMYSGIKEDDKLLEILEGGTVYTYCN